MRLFYSIFAFTQLLLCNGCRVVQLSSELMGVAQFFSLSNSVSESAGLLSGRTAFATSPTSPDDKVMFLYHVLAEPIADGIGRWVINDVLGSTENAIAYINSWAVLPHLVKDVNDQDKLVWKVAGDNAWNDDGSFDIECISAEGLPDQSIYFESSPHALSAGGFFLDAVVDKEVTSYEGPLYSQVKAYDTDVQMYLYKLEDKWIIGETIGQDNGIAFVEDPAPIASEIKNELWRFVVGTEWEVDYGYVMGATEELSIYDALRNHRRVKFIPNGQKITYLRNGLVMPLIGLGTGTIPRELSSQTISTAIKLGYRLLDLAREYKNENIVGDIVKELKFQNENDTLAIRQDLFLVSKLWPTEFGFQSTVNEVFHSIEALKTTYVDMYYIHWPICYPEVEWMHCETTIDQDANWIESYHALEKAYAEGYINSIGVSNFNSELLQYVDEVVNVRPHAVQNFAQIGNMDGEVRQWCFNREALYQPYSSQRDMTTITPEYQKVVEDISTRRGISKQAVSLKFFLQTGAAIIPKSTQEAHLIENLSLFESELTNEEMESLGWKVAKDVEDEAEKDL